MFGNYSVTTTDTVIDFLKNAQHQRNYSRSALTPAFLNQYRHSADQYATSSNELLPMHRRGGFRESCPDQHGELFVHIAGGGMSEVSYYSMCCAGVVLRLTCTKRISRASLSMVIGRHGRL